jgi:hypothetical protein
VTFLFLLSRQKEEPFVNCWMTDAMLWTGPKTPTTNPEVRRCYMGVSGRW